MFHPDTNIMNIKQVFCFRKVHKNKKSQAVMKTAETWHQQSGIQNKSTNPEESFSTKEDVAARKNSTNEQDLAGRKDKVEVRLSGSNPDKNLCSGGELERLEKRDMIATTRTESEHPLESSQFFDHRIVSNKVMKPSEFLAVQNFKQSKEIGQPKKRRQRCVPTVTTYRLK